MIDHERLRDTLAHPSPESWRAIVRMGERLRRDSSTVGRAVQQGFLASLRDRLVSWPKELDRKVPDDWPPGWRVGVEYRIKETETYGLYESGVCGDARLRLSDGSQGVRLRRRFVGSARSLDGSHLMRLGSRGEADLSGGMTIEFVPCCARDGDGDGNCDWHPQGKRVEVTVDLEVKAPDGRQEEDQKKRMLAIQRRGGIYVVAYTVEDAVCKLLSERDRLCQLLGG